MDSKDEFLPLIGDAMSDVRKLLKDFRKHPGMYIPSETYDAVAAFVLGANLGTGGELLEGFRRWLVVKNDGPNNLSWISLVAEIAFTVEEAGPSNEVSELLTSEDLAISKLFNLIDQFLADKAARGLSKIASDYQDWLESQGWGEVK